MLRGRGLAMVAFLIGFGSGIWLLWAFGFVDVWAADIFGGDFSAIWAGPHILATGGDPYDSRTWLDQVAALSVQPPPAPVYIYPGWVAVLLLPFGALDLVTAAQIWIALGLTVAAIGLFVLIDVRARRLPLLHTLLAFAVVGSEAGIVAFYSGQIDLLIVGILGLMVAWLRTGRQGLAGVAAGVMLLKPQLFAVALPALVRLAFARGERRFLIGLGACVLALAAVSTAILPGWWAAWIENVPAARAADLRASTLPNALRDLFGLGGLAGAYVILAASVAAAFAFSPRSRAALPVWLAVSISLAPYMFVYDHVVMIIPVAVAATLTGERSRLGAIVVASAAVLILTVGGTLLHATIGVEQGTLSYNGLVQFALTLLVIGSLWPIRREVAD
ncbi:MAG: DUF2029 domain-containing protein [Chloroflexi bacterium]|nr:DUF2029 domain-containing protein [Chloroflexota bacterium]